MPVTLERPLWEGRRDRIPSVSCLCRLESGAILVAGVVLASGIQPSSVSAQADGAPFQVDSFSQIKIEGARHANNTIGSPVSVSVSGPESEIANLKVLVGFNTLEIKPNDDDKRFAGRISTIT